MTETPPERNLDGADVRIATVVARFNEHITGRLLDGARAAAEHCHLVEHDVSWVPGSFELPVAALLLARSGRYDAVVCLGAVVRHETDHYLHVATAAATGIARVSLDTGVPCIFGVLTCDTDEQALARSSDKRNAGREAVETAVEMALLLRSVPLE